MKSAVNQSEYMCFLPSSTRHMIYLTSLTLNLLFCIMRNLKNRTLKVSFQLITAMSRLKMMYKHSKRERFQWTGMKNNWRPKKNIGMHTYWRLLQWLVMEWQGYEFIRNSDKLQVQVKEWITVVLDRKTWQLLVTYSAWSIN